jgi:hypothetical protein
MTAKKLKPKKSKPLPKYKETAFDTKGCPLHGFQQVSKLSKSFRVIHELLQFTQP